MGMINLPHKWKPRPYQEDFWRYRRNGGLRSCIVAHRRWGKDDVVLHDTAVTAHARIGTYWHMLPEAKQARKAIWDAINPHTGKRRIDEAFPTQIRAVTRDNEMFIKFQCGSTWQVIGSDNFDSVVGSPPVGVTFSEWALADPRAWPYISPILLENGGSATFITTPRGHNHAEATLKLHQSMPDYFSQISTAYETGVFTPDQLERQRIELIAEYGEEYGRAMFEQEYNCSFNAAVLGAYYGYLIDKLERDGRITTVEPEPNVPVDTFWDLGLDDHMAIWVVQFVGGEVRVLEFISGGGVGMEDYIEILKKKAYDWRRDDQKNIVCHGPHDLRVRELTRGKLSRLEVALKMGIRFRIVPDLSVVDGRQAVRAILPRCWFNERLCASGISGLQQHRADWDGERKVLSSKPVGDWTCHGADAFRYMAVTWKNLEKPPTIAPELTPTTAPKGKPLIYAKPDGKIATNINVRDYIDRKKRERDDG